MYFVGQDSWPTYVSIRAPAGGAMPLIIQGLNKLLFQSAPLREGRFKARNLFTNLFPVSIRAPAGGAIRNQDDYGNCA